MHVWHVNNISIYRNQLVTLTKLTPDTLYYIRMGSTDAVGNGPSIDPIETKNPFSEEMFTTLTDPDVTAPRIITGPGVAAVVAISAIITWETDGPSNSLVQYGTSGTSWQTLTYSASDGDMVTQHSVTLTDLMVNTIYYVRVSSVDASGNNYDSAGDGLNPPEEYNFYIDQPVHEPGPSEEILQKPRESSESTCFISTIKE